MEYRLIQYPSSKLDLFNKEINKYLSNGWELNGDLRITVIKSTETNPGYIINSQVLEKETEKPQLGFKN